METQIKIRSLQQASTGFFKKLCILTLGGGIAFWATTIATSLLPIAAQYRAAFSNWSVQTVWVASLFMGMLIACVVSYSLLRLLEKLPAMNPILESVGISCIALVIAIILIDVPTSFHGPLDDRVIYYFFIGVIFNIVRFLFLGAVIGYIYKRLHVSA
jgi:hypothetical protein